MTVVARQAVCRHRSERNANTAVPGACRPRECPVQTLLRAGLATLPGAAPPRFCELSYITTGCREVKGLSMTVIFWQLRPDQEMRLRPADN